MCSLEPIFTKPSSPHPSSVQPYVSSSAHGPHYHFVCLFKSVLLPQLFPSLSSGLTVLGNPWSCQALSYYQPGITSHPWWVVHYFCSLKRTQWESGFICFSVESVLCWGARHREERENYQAEMEYTYQKALCVHICYIYLNVYSIWWLRW